MELSLLMKLRIAVSIAIGVALIGILAWPLAQPPEPFGAVLSSNISLGGKIGLAVLTLVTGFIAYFLSWPYGREIGILAVPAGLAAWAARSGNMATLMQLNPTLDQRQTLLASLKWEPLFWLAIIAVGFAGMLLAQKTYSRPKPKEGQPESTSAKNIYLNAAVGLLAAGLIAQFCITIFAQDVRILDSGRLGSIATQPAVGQIIFALLVAFGIAAFLVKKFLNLSYIWPTIASALVTPFVTTTYVRQDILQYLVQNCPAPFFSNAVTSILPVQMVAVGTLGSIAGYWMAVRYNYWRENENK